METEFPFRGLIEFRDLETGEILELESDDCREAYLSDLTRYIQNMKQLCGRMKVSFETLNTGTPFDRALLAYFHKRERMF